MRTQPTDTTVMPSNESSPEHRPQGWFARTFFDPREKHNWGMLVPLFVAMTLVGLALRSLL